MHSVKNHFIKIKNACSVQSLHKTVSIDRHKHFTSSGCRNCITLCVLNPIQWVKIEDPHEDGDVDNCIQVEAVNYYRKALHLGCCRSPRSALCFCKTINELNQIQWLEAPRLLNVLCTFNLHPVSAKLLLQLALQRLSNSFNRVVGKLCH